MYSPLERYEMEKRQDGPTATALPNGNNIGNNSGDSGTSGTDIPTYVWIVVVIFLAFAVTCGICARRNYRRQYLYRQELLANRPPPVLPFSRIGQPGIFDPNGVGGGILRPPRARRRPSQESVTGLPAYMENPGEREVVLLQRTGPKEDEHQSSQRPTSLDTSDQHPTVPIGTYPPPAAPFPSSNVNDSTAPAIAPNAPAEPHPPSTITRPSEPTMPTTQNRPTEPPGLERAASAPDTAAPANVGTPSVDTAEGRRSPPPPWSSTNPFAQGGSR